MRLLFMSFLDEQLWLPWVSCGSFTEFNRC
jgi:hypothetical protein